MWVIIFLWELDCLSQLPGMFLAEQHAAVMCLRSVIVPVMFLKQYTKIT